MIRPWFLMIITLSANGNTKGVQGMQKSTVYKHSGITGTF